MGRQGADLLTKVADTMQQHHMLSGSGTTRIVVGVSGGADSMCLLLALLKLRERLDLAIWAVHVHHGLRANADGDEQFVRDFCVANDVPLTVVKVDAARYAREHHTGIEEAGHLLRTEAFEAACTRWEAETPGEPCRIALAHHEEDQAETVLFHLCRGSRLRGMRGILPKDGRKIRPLLFVTRGEIEAFLTAQGCAWRIDESNSDVTYKRNLLRGEVLPQLSKEINEGTISHMAAFAAEAAEIEEYLKAETDRALSGCLIGDALSVKALLRYPPLIQRRIVFSLLERCAGARKDLTAVHVESVLQLAGCDHNGILSLPYGMRAEKVYDRLELSKTGCKVETHAEEFPTTEQDYRMRVFAFDGDMTSVPRMKYTKWFDYDKIRTIPTFRTRQVGDEIALSRDGKTKKVTRYMIDVKIPADRRDLIVLPVRDRDVLWIPGGRISARFEVDETTSRVLELSLPFAEEK